VIEENEAVVYQIQQKKQTGKIKFLVGLMMRANEDGKVEAPKAEAAIHDALDVPPRGPLP
jgi:Asp-tRNA(Asn)/Glu-tRNA(Gln) amidotransferase B subunit